MISRLPRWIWAGAWGLALVAGMVNVVGLLGFQQHAVTHLTGTTTMLGAAIAAWQGASAAHFAAIIASFVAGTVLSGFIIQDSTLNLDRRYGVALGLESLLLVVAAVLFGQHSQGGYYLASCACGLQNAMVSTYSGSVIRTAHVSGMFTDLGIYLGHYVRGIPVDRRRVRLCVTVITGFLSGSVVGALAFHSLDYRALFIPAGLAGLAALSFGFYKARRALPESGDNSNQN